MVELNYIKCGNDKELKGWQVNVCICRDIHIEFSSIVTYHVFVHVHVLYIKYIHKNASHHADGGFIWII